MDDQSGYWMAGIGAAVVIGLSWYDTTIMPLQRFKRQSGLSLKELNLTHAMKLDRLINILDVSGARDNKRKELEETVRELPLGVQTTFNEFKGSYVPREEIAKTIYRRLEVRKYIGEKED
ncbi:MAG: hypothetical protein Q7R87_04125 [Nanoarchaeota archaeon]|nr:hypothetical protein [Nanoarchaeota archaeon]